MADEAVKARVHLYGLFKVLEMLPDVDAVAAEAIAGRRLTIEFRVGGVGRVRLHLDNGKVRLETPGAGVGGREFADSRANVVLWFRNAAHLNGMVAGTRQPIPIRGLTKVGFLGGGFAKFMGRLAVYLMPTPEQMADPAFFAANTRMTAILAFFALSEIANYDEAAKRSASGIPDGVIQLDVPGEPGLYLTCRGGSLKTDIGRHENPRCVLWFKDINALNDLLSNRVHTYDAVALGNMGMRGYIPMIENLNPVLGLISGYLK